MNCVGYYYSAFRKAATLHSLPHIALMLLTYKVGSTASCMASICRSFRAGAPEGAERLRCILTDLMTSHTKEDVKIPPPIRTVQKLDMSMQESIAYDAIASYVRANILLTR